MLAVFKSLYVRFWTPASVNSVNSAAGVYQAKGTGGTRGYLAVSGGLDMPVYLGSRATFPGGKLGGVQASAVPQTLMQLGLLCGGACARSVFWAMTLQRCRTPHRMDISMSRSSCLLQGRPLKAGDYLPLGSVAADVKPKAGAEVPAAWRPSYPAAKVLP